MENNLTTQDEPISLRDTIESAIIEETPLASTETAVEAPKSDRVRDDSGKFAKTATADDNDFGFEAESAPVKSGPRNPAQAGSAVRRRSPTVASRPATRAPPP